MPTFQYSPGVDPGSYFDASTWTLTSVNSTTAVWESGDQKLVVTGSGLKLAGGVPAGTITGVKLFQVDLSSGQAVDKLLATNTTPLSLSFAGLVNAADSSEFGFGGDDYIFGGNDTLNGSTGDDLMQGFAGNDVLNGAAGDDYLAGDNDSGGFGGEGGGRDTLNGGDGDDVLNGGGGNDSMAGGNGNDYYEVSEAGDVVTETSTGGAYDRVNFSSQSGLLSYTLAANVENLTVLPFSTTGTAFTVTANGNALSNKIAVVGGFDLASTRLAGLDGNDRLTGSTGRDSLDGGNGNDTLVGAAGNDLLTGRAGNDQSSGGKGNDIFSMTSKIGSDRVTDFKLSGSDKVSFDQSDLAVGFGDADAVVEGAVAVAGPGGFTKAAELVIITGNIAGAITATSAAAKIGSTSAAYAIGDDRVFVVDNGTDSGVFLFTARDADAVVEANELVLLATLAGTSSTVTTDYLFSL